MTPIGGYLPVNEGPLGVHKVELVDESRPGLGDGGRVGKHADRALYFRQISSGWDGWRLVVDSDFES